MRKTLLAITLLGFSAQAMASTQCLAPAFEWLPQGPVTKLERSFRLCHEPGGPARLETRSFEKGGHKYALLVDLTTLETSVDADACLTCVTPEPVTLGNTRFMRAVTESTVPARGIENVGLRHATYWVDGYFLTVDLCPSRKPGFDEQIFDAMEILAGTGGRSPPIGVSISGAWINAHRAQFDWLREQDASRRLSITWINHTATHPYDTHLPENRNFLLEKGVNLDHEILGLEKLLLEGGVVPSVFFRFPGLVANPAVEATVRGYFLIPLASDAWLAKHESPTPGSIILIHGNENEEAGVSDFLNWLDSRRGESPNFFGVRDLFPR